MLTGQRLKDLAYDFSEITVSTMTRANETASFIQKYLPALPTSHCALLVEGAPVPPEPPVGHWKPEAYVSGFIRVQNKVKFRKKMFRDVFTFYCCKIPLHSF